MARRTRKQCPSCRQLFLGRRDAKTCGERCRKRLQRARLMAGAGPVVNFSDAGAGTVGVFTGRYSKSMTTRRSDDRGQAL